MEVHPGATIPKKYRNINIAPTIKLSPLIANPT